MFARPQLNDRRLVAASGSGSKLDADLARAVEASTSRVKKRIEQSVRTHLDVRAEDKRKA